MRGPTILAFYSNGQQAGKNTGAAFAAEWADAHGMTTNSVGFSDLGKQLAALSLGVGANDGVRAMDVFKLEGKLMAVRGGRYVDISGRDYLINLMEGARKLFGETFWTDQVFPAHWEATAGRADITFITDLRANHEAPAILRNHGKIIEVINSRASAINGRLEGGLDAERIDWWLRNEGTLAEYRETVHLMMEEFYG